MAVDISIVSGTFNRKEYLTRMVESVRSSVGSWLSLTYEIVLVDGGSQDGTIEWCRSQSDIRLIEHGKLLGAVKAFNDGAYAALGNYVILANDDIEFLGDSIYFAWTYMQDHSDCGIGCFYQDRGGKGWHVEHMPVVINGQQSWAVYGQVCIVPKWLGDHLGWWGDYLEIYGGDNELSAKVYDAGFKVSPVPETKIHDAEPMDALRKINNLSGTSDPRSVMGHHPDSWAWGRHWRGLPEHLQYPNGSNLVGPVIKTAPVYPNQLTRRERILYLPIYEPGWEIQKMQKRGLREALAKAGVVCELDYMNVKSPVGEIEKTIQSFNPTMILSQIHGPKPLSVSDIQRIRKGYSGIRWINWNGDYWPDSLVSEKGIELARQFDLQTTVNRKALDIYQERGVRAAYWQIGYEPDGTGHSPESFCDVIFLGNGYSPKRKEFVRQIREMPSVDFSLYGQSWPDGWSKGQCLYDFVTACKLYRGAKISLGDSQWPETGFVSNRVFQALAAGGSALAHQWFAGMDELGLKDGQTCIIWQTMDELKEKIRYYLDNENERDRIAKAGEQLALTRHSFECRVSELFEMLNLNHQTEDCWRW